MNVKEWIERARDSKSMTRRFRDFFECGDKVLGRGEYGIVVEGWIKESKQPVVIKILRPSGTYDTERAVLFELDDNPHRYFSFLGTGVCLLILWNRGRSIADLLQHNQMPSWVTGMRVFRHILRDLQILHSKQWIHRDLNVGNACVDEKTKQIRLIDFGLAQRPQKKEFKKSVDIGTLLFSSVNATLKNPQSARDDIESLCFLVWYLVKGGSVPWKEAADAKKVNLKTVAQHKLKTCPIKRLQAILDYVRSLSREDPIDYDHIFNMTRGKR
jgi:serine/threonine protein kinase